MSDLDGLLGKVVVDSIDGANKLSQQMDGWKLIGQRQINALQQEQINTNRGHIRDLETTISSLRKEISNLKGQVSNQDGGPTNGWANVSIIMGYMSRSQSYAGYKKEVERLQSNITHLSKSLLDNKINSKEQSLMIETLSKNPNNTLPFDILNAVIKLSRKKYFPQDDGQPSELLKELTNNEDNHVSWFLSKDIKRFDLIKLDTQTSNFLINWIYQEYVTGEFTLKNYLRENPSKIEEVNNLFTQLNLDHKFTNVFTTSLREQYLFIHHLIAKQVSFAKTQEFQKLLGISNEELSLNFQESRKQILSDNLTERDRKIYNLSLDEKTRNLLKDVDLDNIIIPENVTNKEELDQFQIALLAFQLETKSWNKLLTSLAIQESEVNKKEVRAEDKWVLEYRDNDPGRDILEQITDISVYFDELKDNGYFNFKFLSSLGFFKSYIAEKSRINKNNIVRQRETEKEQKIDNILTERLNKSVNLIKGYKQYEDDITELANNFNFSTSSTLVIPTHIEELLKANETKGSFYFGADEHKEIQKQGLNIPWEELEHISNKFKLICEVRDSLRFSLVADKPENIGSMFSKKMARRVYLKIETPLKEKTPFYSAKFLIDNKAYSIFVNSSYRTSQPLVRYVLLGEFELNQVIKSIGFTMNKDDTTKMHPKTPNGNGKLIFNKDVDSLPESPEHAYIVYTLLQDWKIAKTRTKPPIPNDYGFTREEMVKFSEGLWVDKGQE